MSDTVLHAAGCALAGKGRPDLRRQGHIAAMTHLRVNRAGGLRPGRSLCRSHARDCAVTLMLAPQGANPERTPA
jgi:hypothetical protein